MYILICRPILYKVPHLLNLTVSADKYFCPGLQVLVPIKIQLKPQIRIIYNFIKLNFIKTIEELPADVFVHNRGNTVEL